MAIANGGKDAAIFFLQENMGKCAKTTNRGSWMKNDGKNIINAFLIHKEAIAAKNHCMVEQILRKRLLNKNFNKIGLGRGLHFGKPWSVIYWFSTENLHLESWI